MSDSTVDSGSSAAHSSVASGILGAAARSGVERLWFCSGSELTALQEAAARARKVGEPSPVIMTSPHEHVALSAAMGETMITHLPSMTAVHADLGVLHHGGALHNAFRGGYPVLLLSGYPPTTPEHRTSPVFWYQQRWDQGQTVRQYVKWDHKLSATDDAALIVSRALQVALEPPAGPSYLAVPAEVGRLQSNADPTVSAHTLGIPRLGEGPSDAIRDIALKLLAAERPLVIVERTGRNPKAPALLGELIELLGATVKASRFRLNLSDDHLVSTAGTTLEEADVILLLDCVVPWIPAHQVPARGAWIAAVGEDPAAREVPIYEFPADVRLIVDTTAFLASLVDTVKSAMTSQWSERARARRAHQETLYSRGKQAQPANTGPLTPGDVGRALDHLLDPEDLLVSEVFDTTPVRRTVPGTLFEKGGSSLGWAQAAAVGARLASGGRPTVAVTGDGSYMFGSPDSVLWLQYQHDAPVVTVILNNGGYRTGTTTLDAHFPDGYAVENAELRGGRLEPSLPFAEMAKAAGAFGARVTDREELMSALRTAREVVSQQGVPAVVEVLLKTHAQTVRGNLGTNRQPSWGA